MMTKAELAYVKLVHFVVQIAVMNIVFVSVVFAILKFIISFQFLPMEKYYYDS